MLSAHTRACDPRADTGATPFNHGWFEVRWRAGSFEEALRGQNCGRAVTYIEHAEYSQ